MRTSTSAGNVPPDATPAGPKPDAPPTPAAALSAYARDFPGRSAYLLPVGRWGRRAEKYHAMTYAELDRRSDAVAAGLAAYGVGHGVRTALLVPVGADFFVLAFALLKAGAIPVLVDPGIGTGNLKTCLGEAEPAAFIGSGRAHLARRLLGWCPSVTHAVLVGRAPSRLFRARKLREIERAGVESPGLTPSDRTDDGNELAAVAFTSGSTGVPKGVEYRTRHLLAQATILRLQYAIEPGEVSLATFPPFALLGPSLGLTTILPRMDFTRPAKADPRRLLDAVNQYAATLMFGSPALLETLSRWGTVTKRKMPSMRRVISAGAPVSRSVQRRLLPMLGPDAQVFTPYGATEALPVTSAGSTEVLPLRNEGICIGRPVPGVEVAVVPLTDGPLPDVGDSPGLPPGEVGEIVVRGPNVTEGYLGRPKASALATTRWGGRRAHRMGDAGYLDEDGRLWFCGRVAHRVTTPEGVLYSVPCEEVLNAAPEVARAALVGVGAPGRQRAVFCVELEPFAKDTPQLVDRLREVVAANPLTASVRTILVAPSFPVDIRHNSKIRREELAEWAARRLS